MNKSQLIYYPIMTCLLLNSNVCAERLRITAFGDSQINTPSVTKPINDSADDLPLSARLSRSPDFPSHFINSSTTKSSVPKISIHIEKKANNLLTEHFIPSAPYNPSVDSLMTGISYQINEQLSVEGSMVGQVTTLKKPHISTGWWAQKSVSKATMTPSFAMVAIYQLSDTTQISALYNQGSESDLVLAEKPQALTLLPNRSPQKIVLGVQHHLNNELALAVNANWQKRSSIDTHYDDLYSAGTAVSYQLKHWTLASTFSIDTPLLAIKNNNPLSALEPQWNLAISGTRKINERLSVGLTYQYQALSELEISGYFRGQNSGPDNQEYVHFISTSLRF